MQVQTDAVDIKISPYSDLILKPNSISETGLSQNLLEELLLKQLYDGGVLYINELVERLGLSGPVIEQILTSLRDNAYVEVRGANPETGIFRYALTDRGRLLAADMLKRSGYIGLAPVPVELYFQMVKAQSVHLNKITEEKMREAFSNLVISDAMLHRLGPAVHSGRSIFIYGPPGTGKSYVGQKLSLLMGDDPILIPAAIAIENEIVQLFDPAVHQAVRNYQTDTNFRLDQGHDPRFIICRRPTVVIGGELTLDMLEIKYDPDRRLYQAPPQLKANNGVFFIDDLGRQRVSPTDLFNRWMVPMESRADFLSVKSGNRFEVPFDVILIFSTNLNPEELADQAILRRLGHKIRFGYLTPEEYSAIWRQVCSENGLVFQPEILQYTLEELHTKQKKPLLPCHPRDLLGMAMDEAKYKNRRELDIGMLTTAWDSYFVNTATDKPNN